MLADCLAHPLREPAMGLAVNDKWIDTAAHVVDRGVAGEFQRSGVGINFDFANSATIGEYRIVHFVVRDHCETVF